ncbi:MAG: winged helix-turn-helix transcriptional regulator [Candidatus Nitrosopolaris sp.]
MRADSRTKSGTDKTKSKLLKRINNSPGIRYRELLRVTGFSNGVMAYHLKKLENSKRIKVSRSHRRSTRFYPLSIAARELRVIEFIRRRTARQIVRFLLQDDSRTFKDIVQFTKKVRSTVSWHLSRLREGGIISVGVGRNQTYRLKNRDLVIKVMKKINS